MVKLLSAAGGTKIPSSLPKFDENPDPLFNTAPPWVSQQPTRPIVEDRDKFDKLQQDNKNKYSFMKKSEDKELKIEQSAEKSNKEKLCDNKNKYSFMTKFEKNNLNIEKSTEKSNTEKLNDVV